MIQAPPRTTPASGPGRGARTTRDIRTTGYLRTIRTICDIRAARTARTTRDIA
ncbi:hypothetical protein [Streptomyces sp. YKOK-I1]